MSTVLVTSAVSVPYAPRVGRRLGPRRAFVVLQAVAAAAWLVAGLALLLGMSTMPVLLVAAPVFGITGGLSTVLRPILATSYLSGSGGTAEAFARLSVVSGIGWAVGSLGGGVLLSSVALGWGLVLNGLTIIPLVATVARTTPATEPSTPRATDRPWRTAWSALAGSRTLRWTAVLGASSLLFLAPITSLVVPIAQDLRQSPLVAGAGLLMAAFSIGEFLSPITVRRLRTGRHDLPAGAIAGAIAGATLLVLGVVSAVLVDRLELLVWLVVGVAFGAFRYASRACFTGAAAEAGPPEDASTNLAATMLVSGLAAPVGTTLWSGVIDQVSADAAVVIGGLGGLVLGLVVLAASRATGHGESAET
jgi:MFS family permease